MTSFKFEINYKFEGQYDAGFGGADHEIEKVMTRINSCLEEALKKHPLVWIFEQQFNEFLKNAIGASTVYTPVQLAQDSMKSKFQHASQPIKDDNHKVTELKIEVTGDDDFFAIKITDKGKGFQKRTKDNNDSDYIDDLLNGELVDYNRVLKGAPKLDSTKREEKNNTLGGEGLGLAGVHYFAQFFESTTDETQKGKVFISNEIKTTVNQTAKHGCLIIRFPMQCILNMKSVEKCRSRRPALFVKDFIVTHRDFPTKLSPLDESKGNIQDLSSKNKTVFNFPTPLIKKDELERESLNLKNLPTIENRAAEIQALDSTNVCIMNTSKKGLKLPFALVITSIENKMPIIKPCDPDKEVNETLVTTMEDNMSTGQVSKQKIKPKPGFMLSTLNLPTTTHKNITTPINQTTDSSPRNISTVDVVPTLDRTIDPAHTNSISSSKVLTHLGKGIFTHDKPIATTANSNSKSNSLDIPTPGMG